jgi:hypothetical protein
VLAASRRGWVEQAAGRLKLAVLNGEPVALHEAKHFLDTPAEAVEPHRLLAVGECGDGELGQQMPQQAPALLLIEGNVDALFRDLVTGGV